jgi:NAD(P)-dependent dehydrogenase (short-subunit alcohol dehydrogenase family)
VKDLKNEGFSVHFVHTDVSKPNDIKKLVYLTEDVFGEPDILINNAGISSFIPADDITVKEWDLILNTNLRSCFLASREAANKMKKGSGGSIVNISSTRALMSEKNSEAYAASKGGILALTHAMAVSYGETGIRVNCISPGWIHTGDERDLRESDHNQHPSGRVGVPSDVARACLFLTHPENNFITGENLVLDGGMTRKMIYEE